MPFQSDTDQYSVSVRLDGQASIEHQIDIHVLDLVDATENPDISVNDILQGLKYVVDYRLAGGKLPHLDLELMKRLAQGLLEWTHKKSGNLLNQYPTQDADLAFYLIGDFLSNVVEFRQAIAQVSVSDLRYKLKLHRRCKPRSSEQQRIAAATILGLLTVRIGNQFKDWRDLVDEDEHEDILQLMKEYPDKFSAPAMPIAETILPPPSLYFDKNSEALADMYSSSIDKGLSENQVALHRKFYGVNILPSPPKASLLKMIYTQVTDFMIMILLTAAIVEFATDDAKAAYVVLAVVIINVLIGVTQEYKANQALEALLTLTVPKASVIRDGKQLIIESGDLVPGDLVVLEEGEAVPADLRLCEVAQLEVVESILTGESLPVAKSIRTIRKRSRKLPLGDCKGNAFMTTVVSRGRAKGIVVRTGVSTEIGKISSAISSAPHVRTNIEKKLSQLGKWLVFISIALVVLIVVIGISWKNNAKGMVYIGISLAISVIPEGLVAVVTISMAIGVQRMAKLHAIVRKLPSVEAIGSLTYICSDKTGTLTEGKMGAQQFWSSDNTNYMITHSTSLDPNQGEIQQISSDSLETGIKTNTLSTNHQPKPVSKEIDKMAGPLAASLMASSLCNNSGIAKDEDGKGWKSVGDPTEVALLVAGIKGGLSREWFAASGGLVKLGEYSFDSDRKMMSVLFTTSAGSPSELDSDATFVLTKGAPEAITKRCTHYILKGEEKGFSFLNKLPSAPITEDFVEFLSNQSAQMASCGLRVLALAMRRISLEKGTAIVKSGKHSEAERDLTFVGLIGLIDPPKAGVKESIAISKKAGIKVVMITGDHVETASAIAKDIGIIDPTQASGRRVMQGFEVDLLSEESLACQTPFPVVFARVSPDNKLKIVKALQRQGQSVAMTGDGVNDAPAIKQADVGVAMGIAGTEITKQAADIVLANDDFSTIVAAVKEGRKVYDNILKFVVYLLSCNFAEVLLFLFCVVINKELPFTTIQILWANIFADIPPALSLGLEPPEKDLMDRKPRPPKENVLTRLNIAIIVSQAFIMSSFTFIVYMLALEFNFAGADSTIKRKSLAFTLLSIMQLTQSFLSRSITNSIFVTGITENRVLVFAYFLSFGLLLIGLEVPSISQWLELTDPGPLGWAVVFVCLAIQIVVVELLKLFIRTVFLRGDTASRRLPHMIQIGSVEQL